MVATADMLRQKILLRKRVTPQRVTLPNGQSFLARYEKVSRKNLSGNVTITKARQIRLRQQRKRKTHKVGTILGNIVNLGVRALTSTALLKGRIGIGVKALTPELGKKLRV